MLNGLRTCRVASECNDYALAPNIVFWVVEDGSARLLDLDGSFYALSRSAAELLRATLENGVEAAIDQIAGRYGIKASQVDKDLKQLLATLNRAGVFEAPSRYSKRLRFRQFVTRVVIIPSLRVLSLFNSGETRTVVALIALARLCTAMFGWGLTVETWRAAIRPKTFPLPMQQDDIIQRIDSAIRASAAKIPSAACKERALACWYLLCSLRIPATLIVGVQLYPLAGHCWCQVGNQILTDTAQCCDTFVPVFRYESGGAHAVSLK